MIPFELHFTDGLLTVLFSLGGIGFLFLLKYQWKTSIDIATIKTILENAPWHMEKKAKIRKFKKAA